MSRRRRAVRRITEPDAVYSNVLISKFINCLMIDGGKNLAEKLLYKAMDQLKNKTKEEPILVFKKSISNTKPVLEVKSRRVGGMTYQVPVDVSPERQVSLAIRWLINAARQRSERTMINRLSSEIFESSQNMGGAIKKKDDVHRMAEANRAFAHYRW